MSEKKFIRHQQMKNNTLEEVLRAISDGATCKREVQSKTGLSWGKVSETVNLLLDRQIIHSANIDEPASAGAGRRSSFFEFSRTDFLCMGMELQRRQIITVLTTMGGSLIGHNIMPLTPGLNTGNLRDNVLVAFNTLLEQCKIPREKVIALSFSLTGAVDSFNKIWLRSSHIPDIQDYDFNTIAADFPYLQYFSIEHDIQARARSVLSNEEWNDENFVFMHVGSGVGMAIHNQGGFLYGSRGLAGEIGHIPVMNPPLKTKPRVCSCGQHNCLETFLSDHGLLAFAREEFSLDVNDLPTLFSSATEVQMETFYQYLHPWLLQVGITAANLFDPVTLIMGGELIEPWLDRLESKFYPELQHVSWIGSPGQLKTYRMTSCNSAFGASVNAIEPLIPQLAATLS